MKNNTDLGFQGIDWDQVIELIQSFATSGSGKLEISQLKPKKSAAEALQQVQKVFDASALLATGVRPHFESIDFFDPWHSRLKRKAVLKTIELRDVRSFCLETIALIESLESQQTQWALDIREVLISVEEPLSAIDQIITPSGEIRSDASEKLYNLFREKENLTKQIQNLLDQLVNSHSMQTFLQDRYVTTREGRWVLPIRSGSQHFVQGVIHGSSQTKATVYMEPETVIPVNNRLKQVEVAIEDEIERLLTELSEYLATHAEQFQVTKTILLAADVLLAEAQWSLKIEAQAFDFSSGENQGELILNDVRHPLLSFQGKNPIANSLSLDQKQSILLLSGPNAGGKTVLMKAIGLCAQMARHGLPIPAAAHSRLPFFKEIIVAIGDSQSVGLHLSTFAGHLKLLELAAEQKGSDKLILIDEICGATDPEEGSALARAFIEEMAQNEVFAVVTSHLSPLKGGWDQQSRVMNGSLEYDRGSGHPTYQFIQGVPGESLAIQTAQRVGIGKKVIARAVELLSPTSRLRLEQQNQFEQMKADLQVLKDHLKRETERAQKEKIKFEELSKKLETEKERILSDVEKESRKKLDEMIQLAKAEQTFKKHSTLQDIKSQLPQIIKPAAGSTGSKGTSLGPTTAAEFEKMYPAGSKVFIPSMNSDGLVQSAPNGKGEVLVLSNSLRMMVNWKELKLADATHNPTAKLVRQSSPFTAALADTDRSLDVRGMTVQEALELLETQMDLAVSNQEGRMKIIHGHGTEALKKAIRTQLSRSHFVTKWKAGSPEQGGDGVTWVEMKD